MKKLQKTFIMCVIYSLLFLSLYCQQSEKIPDGSEFSLTRVDVLDRVYPDSIPVPVQYMNPTSVPRGGKVAFQFALRSTENNTGVLEVGSTQNTTGNTFSGEIKTYHLIPVHVEANSSGSNTSGVGKKPPKEWLPYLVRLAPFDVAEAMEETNTLEIKQNTTHGILVDIHVPKDTEPGTFRSSLTIKTDQHIVTAEFAFQVHKTVLEPQPVMVGRWLRYEPMNLTSQVPPPDWWTEEHWTLLKNAGKVLLDYGTTMIHTPFIDGDYPFIEPILYPDGHYEYDFSKFDRWVDMFLEMGFETIAGEPLAFWHYIIPPEYIIARHAESGEKVKIELQNRKAGLEKLDQLRKEYDKGETRKRYMQSPEYLAMKNEWLQLLIPYFKSLNTHLENRNLKSKYVQRVLNEPRLYEDYVEFNNLFKKHVPGVKVINQIHFYFIEDKRFDLSPHVDVMFMPMNRLAEYQELVKERNKQQLKTGLYTMASPQSPWPSYHLDKPLSNNRIFSWLMYMYGVTEHDCWGINWYYGVNPYEASLGPVLYNPGGSPTAAGYPPGDNWLFYPTRDGLIPSMRMVAWRAGLQDYHLLKMLDKVDQNAGKQILSDIANSGVDYTAEPDAYHQARTFILEELDSLE